MARIRSIHPGIFTDDAFMSASPMARILLIGLWCEAWDDGVFEWKPVTLKARIFPADNVDFAALMAEIEGLGFIRSFLSGGKQFGAVRNFQRFQRPQKPNSSGVLTTEIAEFVGARRPHTAPPEPPEPAQYRTGTVAVQEESGTGMIIGAQMEDGEEDGKDDVLIPFPQSKGAARENELKKSGKEGFPAEGSIAYTEPWARIVRQNAPGFDVDQIAAAFRPWCGQHKIHLNRGDIAKVLGKFCQTHSARSKRHG